jgi:hypothetical protein
LFQVLSEYSCGAVADFHRASQYQMGKVIDDQQSWRQASNELVNEEIGK